MIIISAQLILRALFFEISQLHFNIAKCKEINGPWSKWWAI